MVNFGLDYKFEENPREGATPLRLGGLLTPEECVVPSLSSYRAHTSIATSPHAVADAGRLSVPPSALTSETSAPLFNIKRYTAAVTRLNESLKHVRATPVDHALLASGSAMVPLVPFFIRQKARKQRFRKVSGKKGGKTACSLGWPPAGTNHPTLPAHARFPFFALTKADCPNPPPLDPPWIKCCICHPLSSVTRRWQLRSPTSSAATPRSRCSGSPTRPSASSLAVAVRPFHRGGTTQPTAQQRRRPRHLPSRSSHRRRRRRRRPPVGARRLRALTTRRACASCPSREPCEP